ncbi:MAG: biotin/lipoyl-binding protein [Puniceicoccales bacterium]|nr:biotin/lipoyl-binding protein [Puniceicoccales bacterium]
MSKQLRITVEGKTYEVTVEILGEQTAVTNITTVLPAAAAPVATPPPAPAVAPAPTPVAAGAGDVLSPLAATVVSINVKIGQQVKAGEKLATIEAMKMENHIAAPTSGTVTAIHVTPGQSVQDGQPLLSIN